MNRSSSDISLQWCQRAQERGLDFPEEGNTSVSTPHHSGFPRSDLSHRTAPPNPDPAG